MINVGIFLPGNDYLKFKSIVSDLVAYPETGFTHSNQKIKLKILLPTDNLEGLDIVIIPPCETIQLRVKGLHNCVFSDAYIKEALSKVARYCLTENATPLKIITAGNSTAALAQELGLKIMYEMVSDGVAVTDITKGLSSYINGVNIELKSYAAFYQVQVGNHLIHMYKDFGYFLDVLRSAMNKITKPNGGEERSAQIA